MVSNRTDQLSGPAFHTSFLGRERERREIRDLYVENGSRLVTLTGPGGVGKTRLGVESARELASELGARLIYVPLAAAGPEQSVLDLVARAIGVEVVSDDQMLQAIARALGSDPVLMLIDNFEHLLGQAVAVGQLLTSIPSSVVLVTSRAPLEIRGEHVYLVAALGLPADAIRLPVEELRALDAVRLFEERARAVQHDFRVGPANAEAVAEICLRLDGLPLALELAAARSRMLAPAVLLARLDRPLEALRAGPVDTPDRHRSLRAALDWSYELLSEDERRLFERLGVPRGTVSIAAVEALSDDLELDPLDAISSLVSKSLVQPANTRRGDGTESVRFQLLSTVREFALEKLAAGSDYVSANNRFARHLLEVARAVPAEFPMRPEDVDASFDITGVDREPVHGALDWLHRSGQHAELTRTVAVLAPHWFARGALRDAHACLQIALARREGSDPADIARATVALGMIAIQQGSFEYGESQLLVGLDMARASGAEEWIGQASFSLGVVEQDRGFPDRALPYFETARAAFQATDRPVFAAVALNNIGLVTARSRSLPDGLELILDARRSHLELGYPFGVALADRYAGQVLLAMGEGDHARAVLRDSLRLEPALMQGWHVANSIETLALLDALSGEFSRAALLAAGAERLREEIGVPLEPALAPAWGELMDRLEAELPPEVRASARAEGRTLDLGSLIALAMGPVEADLSDAAQPRAAASAAPVAGPTLTARELEVLVLLVQGRTNPEIADALYISPRTVSVHVTHILEKLGAENRSAAVALALRSGLVIPED